jgi:hypothetical protein
MVAAEAFAVIGIVTNIITLVETAVEIYDRYNSFSDNAKHVPSSFRDIRDRLKLISHNLQITELCINNDHVDTGALVALRPVLTSCEKKIQDLNVIFDKCIPAHNASAFKKGWKAISSLRRDKDVKSITDALDSFIKDITLFHAARTAFSRTIPQLAVLKTYYDYDKQSVTRHFTGRQPILDHMNRSFSRSSTATLPHIVVLHGAGGMGKSQLALKFAETYENDYDLIFKVDCTERRTVEKGLAQLASKILPAPQLHQRMSWTLSRQV